MISVKRILLVAAIAGLGLVVWFKFFPGDEKVIRKQLEKVARLASFSADEAPLTRLGNAKELANSFTPDVRIEINLQGLREQSIEGRDRVFEMGMAARGAGPGAKVELIDPVVDFPGSRDSAIVGLTLKVQVSGQPDLGVQEMRLTMKKLSGEWLIQRVETVKTLR
ncbi:MAG: nuclear transport factor 2 family protein [Opitutaceae bacterium]|nr:nuclear transport factor 2 family protein [Verrucomicrobiales bacterium]